MWAIVVIFILSGEPKLALQTVLPTKEKCHALGTKLDLDFPKETHGKGKALWVCTEVVDPKEGV